MLKKFITGFVMLNVMCALFIGGALLGGHMQQNKVVETSAQVADESNIIAVVNEDIGANYLGEDIVFADEIIKTLPSSVYTVVPSQMAEQGLENGTYAAVITFPTEFSQSITTVNELVPTPASMSYQLNMNLSDQKLVNVTTELLDLQSEINQRLSFMFVSSMYDEVHVAQDQVGTVLENDKTDMEALYEIENANLMGNLDLTTMPHYIVEFTPLDISEYEQNSSEVLTTTNKLYTESLEASLKESQTIAEFANEKVNNETDGVASYKKSIEELEFLLPYTNGTESYTDVLEYLNKTKDKQYSDAFAKYIYDINNPATEKPVKITIDTNAQNATYVPQDLVIETNDLENEIRNASATLQLDPTQLAAFESAITPAIDTYTETVINGLKDEIETQLINSINLRIPINEEWVLSNINTSTYNTATAEADLKDAISIEVQNTINNTDMTGTLNLLADDFVKVVTDTQLAIDKSNEQVSTYISTSLATISADQQPLTTTRQFIDKTETDAKAKLNKDFDEKLVMMNSIVKMMQEYDPTKTVKENSQKFEELNNQFTGNMSMMQAEIDKKANADTEQLGNIYDDNIEHVSQLTEDVTKTKEETDKLTEQAVNDFAAVKTQTSASNIYAMGEFSNKMPNSKIGSLGNNNLYSFMASPVTSVNTGYAVRPGAIAPPQIRPATSQEKAITLFAINIFLLILSLILIIVLSIVYAVKNRGRTKKEIVINDYLDIINDIE